MADDKHYVVLFSINKQRGHRESSTRSVKRSFGKGFSVGSISLLGSSSYDVLERHLTNTSNLRKSLTCNKKHKGASRCLSHSICDDVHAGPACHKPKFANMEVLWRV